MPNAIDSVNGHTDLLAESKLPACSLTCEPVPALLIVVNIVDEGRDMNQAFDEEFIQLDVETVLLHTGYDAVEFIADAINHEVRLPPVHQLAFGVRGSALSLARLIADRLKRRAKLGLTFFIKKGPRHSLDRMPGAEVDILRVARSTPLDDFAKDPMND